MCFGWAPSLGLQFRMRPAVGGELAKQNVRVLATAPATEQEAVSSVGFGNFPPPCLGSSETSDAWALVQRLGNEHLASLRAHSVGQRRDVLRNEGVGEQEHVLCGNSTFR